MAVMKLLMLGGTRFLGRALVDDALARGWEVTVLHRALGDRRWDFVVDTWSGNPRVVGENARVLHGLPPEIERELLSAGV